MRLSELLIIALYVIPTVWALSDAVRHPSSTWQVSDQNQVVWIVVVILVPLLGPILYYLIARPALDGS
jgi:hypothetical protein